MTSMHLYRTIFSARSRETSPAVAALQIARRDQLAAGVLDLAREVRRERGGQHLAMAVVAGAGLGARHRDEAVRRGGVAIRRPDDVGQLAADERCVVVHRALGRVAGTGPDLVAGDGV